MIGLEQEVIESVAFNVVLINADVESLRGCQAVNELADQHLRPTSAAGWSMIHSAGLRTDRIEDLAEALSKELAVAILAILYEDTSGWFSFAAFEGGAKVQDYSFGYMGDEAPPPDIAERVLHNEDYLIFLANGFGAEVSDATLKSEWDCVDLLLRERGAFLGWEAIGD